MEATSTKFKTVEQYLSTFPPAIRKILKEVRQAIRNAAPRAEEVISYNMPAFKLNGVLVFYAAHQKHIGFYPTPSAIKAFQTELAQYENSKGAVQFPIDKPMPVDLITKIVQFRVKENLEKTKRKKKDRTNQNLNKSFKMTDIYSINDDIKVACVKADSFPEGIGAAWAKLFSSLPSQEGRKLYGISYGGENGKITYMAAVEELHEGEADQLGLDTFVVRKGEYVSEFLEDWRRDETQIAKTFRELLKDPRIDTKEGYCLEMYLNSKDVLCLVKLNSSNN